MGRRPAPELPSPSILDNRFLSQRKFQHSRQYNQHRHRAGFWLLCGYITIFGIDRFSDGFAAGVD